MIINGKYLEEEEEEGLFQDAVPEFGQRD